MPVYIEDFGEFEVGQRLTGTLCSYMVMLVFVFRCAKGLNARILVFRWFRMTQKPIQVPSLYVGNLSRQVTQALLYEIFSAAGPITSAKIITDKLVRIQTQISVTD